MSFLTIPEQGGLSVQACAERARGTAPALRRRLAAFLYEGVLLFGLVMVVGLGTLPPCRFTISKRGQRDPTGGIPRLFWSSGVLQKH